MALTAPGVALGAVESASGPAPDQPLAGLAIVKRAVEGHGGSIWAESAGPGRGSTFCFTLGRSERPAAADRG